MQCELAVSADQQSGDSVHSITVMTTRLVLCHKHSEPALLVVRHVDVPLLHFWAKDTLCEV